MRKIKQSGNKLYGLEVCKSLSMPREFLTLANKLRCNNISTKSRFKSKCFKVQ